MSLFTDLKTVLTPYANKINGIPSAISEAVDASEKKLINDDLINISEPGIWLRGALTNIGRGVGTAAEKDYAAHISFSLPEEVKYIDVDDNYEIYMVGFDSTYTALPAVQENEEWVPGKNPVKAWAETTGAIDMNGYTRYDLDVIRAKDTSVKYIQLAARGNVDGHSGSSSGLTMSCYDAAEHIRILATNTIKTYNTEKEYTFKPEDFAYCLFSESNKYIDSNSDSAFRYCGTPRIKVNKGDYITTTYNPDWRVHISKFRSDDNMNISFMTTDVLLNGDSARAYTDGYFFIWIRKTADNVNAKPIEIPITVTLHRTANESRVKDRNLIEQSRYSNANKVLTLGHFSDLHGSEACLDEMMSFYNENRDLIDGFVCTGDVDYYYYGYSVNDTYISEYDSSNSYSVGDYAVYKGALYVCTASTTGSWNSSSWSVVISNANGMSEANYNTRDLYVNHDMAENALMVLGNHDTNLLNYNTSKSGSSAIEKTNKWYTLSKALPRAKFFDPFISKWGVTMGSDTNACYWYKDYGTETNSTRPKIRLIGIDMQYWDSTEATWLATLLADAETNGFSVILLSHACLGPMTGNTDTGFQNLNSVTWEGEYENSSGHKYGSYQKNDAMEILAQYEDIIICNLVGHRHADGFGYYDDADILVVNITQAAGMRSVYDDARPEDTDYKWAYNIITVEPEASLLKIVRVGLDSDAYHRCKKVLCYNYAKKEIVSNTFTDDIDRIDEELDKVIKYEEVEWTPVSGQINTSTGSAQTNTKRIRTQGASIPVSCKGDYILCKHGYQMQAFAYNGTLSTTNFIAKITDDWFTGKFYIPDAYVGKFIGFCVQRVDEGEMEDEVSTIKQHVSMYRQVLSENRFKSKTKITEKFTIQINRSWPGNGSTSDDVESDTLVDHLCALRLPETYTREGKPTPLIMFCHGASCRITSDSWYNGGTFPALIKTFSDAGYAIFDVNNTRDDADGYPDWGGLPLMTAYIKAWDYIKENYNVDDRLYIMSDSMGTCANLNMMKWYGSDIIASIMTAPRPICSARYAKYISDGDTTTASKMATAFGLSGTEWESDRLKFFDQYENIVTINNVPYVMHNFPPMKVMVGTADEDFLDETRAFYQAVANYGNYVDYREVTGANHAEMSFLSIGDLKQEALAWFDRFRYSESQATN